jgi:hypothetical protein
LQPNPLRPQFPQDLLRQLRQSDLARLQALEPAP